jgi:ATP adenylyltransferase
MNRFPYTSGHLLIVPYSHESGLDNLDSESRAELIELANRAAIVLQKIYKPEGFNLGMNIGEVAGAGIADHIHMHVVPRWGGDTNFMSSLAHTRVLPEALEVSYQRIREGWNNSG